MIKSWFFLSFLALLGLFSPAFAQEEMGHQASPAASPSSQSFLSELSPQGDSSASISAHLSAVALAQSQRQSALNTPLLPNLSLSERAIEALIQQGDPTSARDAEALLTQRLRLLQIALQKELLNPKQPIPRPNWKLWGEAQLSSTHEVQTQWIGLNQAADALLQQEQLRHVRKCHALSQAIDRANKQRARLLPLLPRELKWSLYGFGEKAQNEAINEGIRAWLRLEADALVWAQTHREQPGKQSLTWLACASLLGLFALLNQRLAWSSGKGIQVGLSGEKGRHFIASLQLWTWALGLYALAPLLPWPWAGWWPWELGLDLVLGLCLALAWHRSLILMQSMALRWPWQALQQLGSVLLLWAFSLNIVRDVLGAGTAWHWAQSLWWLLAPFLILGLMQNLSPWLYANLQAKHHPNALEQWALARQKQVLAPVGAALLVAVFAWRRSRRALLQALSRSILGRRFLAWWFRQQLDRKGGQAQEGLQAALPAWVQRFSPEGSQSTDWVLGPHAMPLEALSEALKQKQGGLLALVGAKGMGKSRVLRELQGRHRLLVLELKGRGPAAWESLKADWVAAGGRAEPHMWQAPEGVDCIAFDGMEALLREGMGGLAWLDGFLPLLLNLARQHCVVVAWDAAFWPFLVRARGENLQWDRVWQLEPWREEAIGTLLRQALKDLGLKPRLDLLLDELHAGADEEESLEALAQAETNLLRLIWDDSEGNPSVALVLWCQLLRHLPEKPNEAWLSRPTPNGEAAMEAWDEHAAYVLRALWQWRAMDAQALARASAQDLALVQSVLRRAEAQGLAERQGDGHQVPWSAWAKVTRFLHRRHLVAAP